MTTRPLKPHAEGEERYWFVTPERYCAMLARLGKAVAGLATAPDSVVGIKRSGLFPAVYLSHVFQLPMFTDGEAKAFPYPRFQYPLIVDATAWTGKSLRRTTLRLERSGVPADNIQALVAWVREDPLPPVARLSYVEASDRIMHFWYDEEDQP